MAKQVSSKTKKTGAKQTVLSIKDLETINPVKLMMHTLQGLASIHERVSELLVLANNLEQKVNMLMSTANLDESKVKAAIDKLFEEEEEENKKSKKA